MTEKIVAYARKDKRSENGILMCVGCSGKAVPRWVIRPEELKNYNKDDFIPLTKTTIAMRGEIDMYKAWGFI